MKKLIAVVTLLGFMGAAGISLADTTNPTHALTPKKRLKIQHKRIKEGIKDGTISKDEAKQLRSEGKEINQERKADLKKDGGKLTAEDRKTLEQKEDQRSKEIYQDKHN